MKFLTPEIEALYKHHFGSTNQKSLIRTSKSCGIFQDYHINEETPQTFHRKNTK